MKSLNVGVVFKPNYKLHITIDDLILLNQFKDIFETREQVVYRTKGKNGQLRREMRIVPLWTEVDETTVAIDAGLFDFVSKWLPHLIDRDVYKPQIELSIPDIQPVELSERWKEMLRDNQKDDINRLTRFYNGIAAQHTGYGKTLCMLAILDCIAGRSLILVPNNGILEEVQLRGEQFGVPISKYDWTQERNILNPVAFLRSKERENPECRRWLDRVTNVFTDEAHYLQANSWERLFNKYLPRVQRAYGFSASPDSKDGMVLTPESGSLKTMGPKSAKILGLSGPTRVIRKSTASVTLVDIKADISSPNLAELGYDNWQEALTHMLKRPLLGGVIAYVMERFPATKFYIPIHKIDAAQDLYRSIVRRGHKGVFWSSKGIIPPCPDSNRDDLDWVKELVNLPDFRFLMTTSLGFEGIDIPALSGIIPLIGKSYRMVMQPAGRSARGGSLIYVVIHDTYNKIMLRHSKERKTWMEKEYPIDHRVRLNFQE